MDLSWLQYLRDGIGLAGLCALLIAVIMLRQQPRGKAEALTIEPTPNGNGTNGKVTKDWVRAAMADQCRDCPSIARLETQITQMRAEMQTGLRGVHDRLDQVLLEKPRR